MHVLNHVTGSLSPEKGQAELPDHFDPAMVAALRSSNATSRFVPLSFPSGRLPIGSLPCPEDDPEDSAMVAVEFDIVLHEAKIQLSETPVRLQCYLMGRADAEHIPYDWLGFIWGLDPAALCGEPVFMVWLPSLEDWCYVSLAAMSADGNRGDYLEVTTIEDLVGGARDGLSTEGGLAFDRDPISLGDVLALNTGANASVVPSPEHWRGLMRGAGGAPAFADAVLGAGESGDAGNLTAAGRIDPSDTSQQAEASKWLQSESFERLAAQ